MSLIEADFNAPREGDLILLLGGRAHHPALIADQWVWAGEAGVRVGAQVVEREGSLFLRPEWNTLEREASFATEEERQDRMRWARRELRRWPDRREARVLFQVIAVMAGEWPPSQADYLRSRGAEALGLRELALDSAKEAVDVDPRNPLFLQQYFDLLDDVHPSRARAEATKLLSRPVIMPGEVLAVLQVVGKMIWQGPIEDVQGLARNVLALTDAFGDPQIHGQIGNAALTLVHEVRGGIMRRLGQDEAADAEFSLAVAMSPRHPGGYALRGLLRYPAEGAVADLETAANLGIKGFWVQYYLAHDALLSRDWSRLQQQCEAVLAGAPPVGIKANSLEWLAIARFELGGSPEQALESLEQAAVLAPSAAHIRKNIERIEAVVATRVHGPQVVAWHRERDVTYDLADWQPDTKRAA